MTSDIPPRNSTNSHANISVNSSVHNSASSGDSNNSGRPSFSEQITALGARISRVISRDGSQVTHSTMTSSSTYVGDTTSASAADGLGFGLGKLRSLSFLGLPSDAETCEFSLFCAPFVCVCFSSNPFLYLCLAVSIWNCCLEFRIFLH